VITSTAIGPQFGVGYEWPVSPHLLVSPFINVAFGIVGGSLKFNGGKIQGGPGVSLAQLGLGLTWHQVRVRALVQRNPAFVIAPAPPRVVPIATSRSWSVG